MFFAQAFFTKPFSPIVDRSVFFYIFRQPTCFLLYSRVDTPVVVGRANTVHALFIFWFQQNLLHVLQMQYKISMQFKVTYMKKARSTG